MRKKFLQSLIIMSAIIGFSEKSNATDSEDSNAIQCITSEPGQCVTSCVAYCTAIGELPARNAMMHRLTKCKDDPHKPCWCQCTPPAPPHK